MVVSPVGDRRMIRVHVEVFRADGSEDLYDLPDGWDGWPPDAQEEYLGSLAENAVYEVANGGAVIVKVDENGREVPGG